MANTHSATLVRASSQYFSAADSASLSLSGNFTFEAWVKITTAPTSGQQFAIINKDDNGSNRSYSLWYNNSGGTLQLSATLFGSSYSYPNDYVNVTANTNLGTATWQHVAVVCTLANASASKFEFFVNGTSIGNGSVADGNGTTTIKDGTASLFIGHGHTAEYFDGQIDDVRVWNTARTSTQIVDNYKTELVGNESGLQAYWKLNNALTDSTSNSNTLTNNGTATFTADLPIWSLSTNLQAYYKLDESSGNAADSSGNSNTATNVNTATYSAGKINNGVSLNGSSQYLLADDSATLSITGDLTLSGWVKFASIGAGNVALINKWNYTGSQRSFVLYSNNASFTFYVCSDGAAASTSTTVSWSPATATWYHVAVVYSAAAHTTKYYVNGTQQGATQDQVRTSIFEGTGKLSLGATYDSTDGAAAFLNGMVDEVGIWSRALTSVEVTELYNNNLANAYPFTEYALTEYLGSLDDTSNFGVGSKSAQGFKIASGNKITGFSIQGSKGNTTPCTSFTASIYEGGADPTAGTLKASESFSSNGLGAYTASPTFHSFYFATPTTTLTGGTTQYYLVISPDDGTGTDVIRWAADTTSPTYADGTSWYLGGWTESTGIDRNFAIFGEAVTAPLPSVSDTSTLTEDISISAFTVVSPKLDGSTDSGTGMRWGLKIIG